MRQQVSRSEMLEMRRRWAWGLLREGYSLASIADELRVSARAVRQWRAAGRRGGRGLGARPRSGRPGKLSTDNLARLIGYLVDAALKAGRRSRSGPHWRSRLGRWVRQRTVAGVIRECSRRGQPVSASTVYAWVSGTRLPSDKLTGTILRASQGMLTERDLQPLQSRRFGHHGRLAVPLTTEEIARWVKASFNIEYHPRHLSRLLRRHGLFSARKTPVRASSQSR